MTHATQPATAWRPLPPPTVQIHGSDEEWSAHFGWTRSDGEFVPVFGMVYFAELDPLAPKAFRDDDVLGDDPKLIVFEQGSGDAIERYEVPLSEVARSLFHHLEHGSTVTRYPADPVEGRNVWITPYQPSPLLDGDDPAHAYWEYRVEFSATGREKSEPVTVTMAMPVIDLVAQVVDATFDLADPEQRNVLARIAWLRHGVAEVCNAYDVHQGSFEWDSLGTDEWVLLSRDRRDDAQRWLTTHKDPDAALEYAESDHDGDPEVLINLVDGRELRPHHGLSWKVDA